VHFLVNAQGYEPLITHVFIEGDKYLDSDAVFGVKDELISKIEHHNEPVMPDGKPASGPWHVMSYEFQMKPGTGAVPRPLMSAAE
jgi:hydroxyquinol 1,2-dioxygenase